MIRQEHRIQGCRNLLRDRLSAAALVARSLAILFTVGLISVSTATAGEFKTYDMMGFDYVPATHQGKGLEKVPVLYMCAFFRADYVRHVNNCSGIDLSQPVEGIRDVIELRAEQSRSLPIVAIDIEGGVWALTSNDPEIARGAVKRFQDLIKIWQGKNTSTKILFYGGVPRVVWELESDNQAGQAAKFARARDIIAPLFAENEEYDNDLIGLWPAAYVWYDKPDFFREERKWQIKVCKSVYQTTCYFAIKPQYSAYYDSGTGFQLHMDQNSFLDIMKTLKEDGADGIGLWISPKHISEDYEYTMQVWSWSGGAAGPQRDRDMGWMSALERFLDFNIAIEPDPSAADYCVGSLVAAAEVACPASVSGRIQNWGWLSRYLK